MSPPTIANGHVYLSSFGTQNVGTGQLCVYGLLPRPSAGKLATPSGIRLTVDGPDSTTLSWDAVAGARFYRVSRSTTHSPETKLIAAGLTTPVFIVAAPERGDPATYTVVAVGRNGASAVSQAVTTPGPVAKKKPEED